MAGELYHYFVEGECEQAFVKAFMHANKGDYRLKPGKVEVCNLIFNKISTTKAMSIKRGTKVVIIFDTDIKQTNIFDDNVDTLLRFNLDIIFIPSVQNFEEEIVRACSNIKSIDSILNSNGIEDFKKQFIKHKDIVSKLISVGFDLKSMWSSQPKTPFDKYKNNSLKVKEKRD